MVTQRVGIGLVATAMGLAVWGGLAVAQLGYLWPVPVILPDTISFHGGPHHKQAGCHSRSWYDHHGGGSGAETARRLGTLKSALVVGELPEYSLHLHTHNGYVLVPSGECFVMYLSDAA